MISFFCNRCGSSIFVLLVKIIVLSWKVSICATALSNSGNWISVTLIEYSWHITQFNASNSYPEHQSNLYPSNGYSNIHLCIRFQQINSVENAWFTWTPPINLGVCVASPGHQRPWYWLWRMGRSSSYLRQDFNHLCLINIEEWHVNICLMFPLKSLALKGLTRCDRMMH